MELVSSRQLATLLAVALGLMPLLSGCFLSPEKRKMSYLKSGKQYMQEKKYEAAAIEFRNAAKIDPRSAEAEYGLAQAELELHEWSSALADLSKTIELDPNRLDARLDRARLSLAAGGKQAGFLTQASQDVNFILHEDPNNIGAHEVLGSLDAAQKNYDQALEQFSLLAALEPAKAQPYLDIGLVQMALGHFPEAEESFKKAVSVDPSAISAYIDFADYYRLEKKFPDAEKVFEQGAERNPGSMPLYLSWASLLETEQKTTEADSVLGKLREQSPKSAAVALAIGDFYFARKKLTEASGEYRRGLGLEPNNLSLEERLEDVYLTTGQAQPAAAIDAMVTKQAPHDVIARVDHGRLLLAEEKPQDAVNYFQQVASDFADSPQAHYYLGVAYSQNSNPSEANAEFQNALRISPGLPIALEALARLNLSLNHAAVAQIYAQELVEKNPSDAGYLLLLGEAYLRQGLNSQAEQQLLAAQKMSPEDPSVLLALGQFYAITKNSAQAEKEYQAARTAAPENFGVLGAYASYLVAQGKTAEAASLVQQFLGSHPNDASAHLVLGSLKLQQKDLTAARGETTEAIALDSKLFPAYLQLGQIFQKQGDNSGAIEQYQKALSLKPNSASVMAVIGSVYLDEMNYEKAIPLFEQALSVDSNLAVAANNLAWIYAEQGKNLDVALGLAQKAIALNPDVVAFSDTLGWVMYKQKNYDSAIPLLQQCVKKAPTSAEYRYHLGMLLLAKGEKSQGASELKQALELKLSGDAATTAREALAHTD
jgi:tetratricopeptide (TPR) repeat protein